MADVVKKGELFAPEVVNDLISKVVGKSALARLSNAVPVNFNGNEYYSFTMDDEVNLVAEGGAKTRGHIAIAPKTIVPVKVEYGARITDEFMYATDEKKLDILKQFNDGYAKKLARGLDIMAFHRLNPRTATVADLIKAENAFDTADVATVEYDSSVVNGADAVIEQAIAKLADYCDLTGIAMTRDFAFDLAKTTQDTEGKGVRLYPELRWGASTATINGVPVDVNSTLSFNDSVDKAIVGDFQNFFKWGVAKQIPLEIIEYGNPDNSDDGDLKGHNQVFLRAETYLGFAIMDPKAFALIAKKA